MTKAIEEGEDYDVWWLFGDLFIERTRNGQMGGSGFASFIGSLVVWWFFLGFRVLRASGFFLKLWGGR